MDPLDNFTILKNKYSRRPSRFPYYLLTLIVLASVGVFLIFREIGYTWFGFVFIIIMLPISRYLVKEIVEEKNDVNAWTSGQQHRREEALVLIGIIILIALLLWGFVPPEWWEQIFIFLKKFL